MKRIIFLLAFILLIPASSRSQVVETNSGNDNLALQKLQLLGNLQNLETRSNYLSAPLARALAKAEIADAAWSFDKEWATKLLRDAYKLTLPDEDEQTSLKNKPAGSAPVPPAPEQRARRAIQSRILSVARRDTKFAQELAQLGAERQGAYESHLQYTTLALQTLQNGDKEGAAALLNKAIEADPTLITAPFAILYLAERDPKLADKLILQYIERLRTFPLSTANESTMRVFLSLHNLIFRPFSPNTKAPPPGLAVMRAYVSFMLNSLSRLEQSEPGFLKRQRGMLLMVWPVLQRYAPDLTAEFASLEQLSQGSNNNSPLPTWETFSSDKNEKADYETRIKDALESDQPNDLIINRAISRGDFTKARKLIDKLSDSPKKTQLTETVNAKETLSLLKKDNLTEAQQLAENLKRASSILEVYPALIGKCAGSKDQICATRLMWQAMKQLKASDTTPPTPPAGTPTSVIATSREFDPILDGLAKLTLAVFPLDNELAMEGLNETVAAANASQVDTGQGRVGFDVNIFKRIAPKNEARVQMAAESLKDPLRYVVALAAIYQWKAEGLKKIEGMQKAQGLSKPQAQKTKQL